MSTTDENGHIIFDWTPPERLLAVAPKAQESIARFTLRPYQEDAISKMKWAMKLDGNDLLILPTGCHEKGYPILLSNGSLKAVEDIEVGDRVMGRDSQPREIIALHRGREEGYRITTIKKESFCVNAGHILHLRSSSPDKYYPDHVDITVDDYLKWAPSRKHMYKLEKVGYEMNRPVAIPYMLGLWLGDGSSNCCQMTNIDPEIIQYLKDFSAEHNLQYRKLSAKYLHSITSKTLIPRKKKYYNHFRSMLAYHDLFNNKHIPEEYFQASRYARLALLAGILDTDGSLPAGRNCYELGLSDERLFDDCIRLIRSLGFACSKRSRKDKADRISFRTSISGEGIELIPCLIKRKQAQPRKQIKNATRYGFRVEAIGLMDYYGFTLADDPYYIDGQGFVQHNSGKSLIVATLANELPALMKAVAGREERTQVLILQPSKEILDQNYKKLQQYFRPDQIGIFSASMGRKDINQVTLGTIQSVYKYPELFLNVRLVIIDECDLVNQKNENGMYSSFLKAIENPKVIGLTATPYRLVNCYERVPGWGGTDELICQVGIKLINRMKPFFWTRLLFNINNRELVEKGYLCPLRYESADLMKQEDMPLNKSKSDFDLEAYEQKVKGKDGVIVEKLRENMPRHKSILFFCPSIAQAHRLHKITPDIERVSAVVTGTTPAKERDRIIEGFKDGSIKIVFNVGVLTTGFDHPALDCIMLNRPTKSIRLYYQMLGRGVRLFPGKSFCRVIDFTNSVEQIGPVESIELVRCIDPLDEPYQGQPLKPKWNLKTATGLWNGRILYRWIKEIPKKPASTELYKQSGFHADDLPF